MTKPKTNTTRARYTLEFKQEAVRLVEGGQSIAAAALGQSKPSGQAQRGGQQVGDSGADGNCATAS